MGVAAALRDSSHTYMGGLLSWVISGPYNSRGDARLSYCVLSYIVSLRKANLVDILWQLWNKSFLFFPTLHGRRVDY